MEKYEHITKAGGCKMFKRVNGRLVHLTDPSRVKFRTNISKAILDELTDLAEKNDTHINYLLETGLTAVLDTGVIVFNKALRPKDRIQYKTSYDKELIEKVREFAKKNGLCANDVIEYSVSYIDTDRAKSKDHRSRIEMNS